MNKTALSKHPFTLDDAPDLVEQLADVAIALSQEKNQDLLLERILLEAQSIANADGGTLYVLDDEHDVLEYTIVRTDSLNVAYGGRDEKIAPFKPIRLYNDRGAPNLSTQVVRAVLEQVPINIDDVYTASTDFDFKGTKVFDETFHYRTQSVLTIPMVNHKKETIGCLQLVNAKAEDGQTIPFSEDICQIVHALASQAAVILDNKQLIEAQRALLESFVKIIAGAIDAKSPYTGEHCSRVPVLTEMFAEAACNTTEGKFAHFSLTDEEKYELHIAGWLHDCGKIVTPVHIMDKATKMETIYDRIELVRLRYEILMRDAKVALLEKAIDEATYKTRMAELEEELAFIENANIGGEFMEDEDIERLDAIGKKRWNMTSGEPLPLLTDDEIYNLSTRRGTITPEERQIMNDHMVHTVNMLESMPWPKHLRRVPEYACGHHEKMDGTGYPKGLLASTMSIPARMMAVADVFEALTASDRPYKKAKTLSEAMEIIRKFKQINHLDPDLVDFFITSGTYKKYAEMYLTPELIDEVDEAAILTTEPEQMQTRKKKASPT